MSKKKMQSTEMKDHTSLARTLRMTSIEERLRRVSTALTLIHAACQIEYESADAEEILEAIAKSVEAAKDDLYWVARLPGVVLNLPAPTDDELRYASQGEDIDDLDEHLERLVRAVSRVSGTEPGNTGRAR